jgi:hypothetical protein
MHNDKFAAGALYLSQQGVQSERIPKHIGLVAAVGTLAANLNKAGRYNADLRSIPL